MSKFTPTLIGLPWDVNSSYLRGAAAAPPLIRQALFSPASNSWTESLIDISLPGNLADAGDLTLPENDNALPLIEEGISRLARDRGLPLALGGDHAVTYPILRALGPLYPHLTILHFDSHPDLYAEFDGKRFSHACPFARILEENLIDRLVQVGIRGMNGHQRMQAERFGVETIDMRAWVAGVRPRVEGPLYISIDLDGLDPAFAPGVSHREPGGLSVREVITVIQSLPGPIVGADVVEYNPTQDVFGLTAWVAAKLVKELIARMLETNPQELEQQT